MSSCACWVDSAPGSCWQAVACLSHSPNCLTEHTFPQKPGLMYRPDVCGLHLRQDSQATWANIQHSRHQHQGGHALEGSLPLTAGKQAIVL